MAHAQTAALLRGFYDVLPEVLLSVFDFQELELLLCGLPEIDLGDWRLHTEYRGLLERKGAAHKVVGWFWDAVEAMDEEKRARLLQFVTGGWWCWCRCRCRCCSRACLLACLLAGLLACWLAGLLACLFAGWLAGLLACLLARSLASGWLVGLPACPTPAARPSSSCHY
jgi:hypothetical protein